MYTQDEFVTFATNTATLLPLFDQARSAASVKHPNRVKEFREKSGLSQDVLGDRCGWSQQKISNIERGRSILKLDDARAIAAVFFCAPSDLMAEHRGRSIAVEMIVASFESEESPESFDLPKPHEMVPPPRRLSEPENCFVAEIADHSADRLYPPGSTVVVRRLPPMGAKLEIGIEVLVRHFAGKRREGQTMEVLVGLLDRSVTGDLVLAVPSHDRRIPTSILIQPAPASFTSLSEHTQAFLTREQKVDYAPHDDDPAEIIGEIVYATVSRSRVSA